MKTVHIGSIVAKALREQNLSPRQLASELCYARGSVYKLLSKQSLDTELLIRISKLLKHNLLRDLSDAIEENTG